MEPILQNPAIVATAIWVAANVLLMLGLGVNVSRLRIAAYRSGTSNEDQLQRAVRAHGNNTEYVPGALLLLLMLALTGWSASVVHGAGATLLVLRVLQAVGMQQVSDGIPPARIIGNLGTWVLMTAMAIAVVAGVIQ